MKKAVIIVTLATILSLLLYLGNLLVKQISCDLTQNEDANIACHQKLYAHETPNNPNLLKDLINVQ